MKLRYTRQALADLADARAYIAERNPRAAALIAAHLRRSIDGLRQFPERGRAGRIEKTRELVVPDTPFIVAYRITGQHIDVLAIIHGARRWPRTLPSNYQDN